MNDIVLVPMKWRTFDGKTVTAFDVDHQHLSNVFWYWKIIVGASERELTEIKAYLKFRFNGQVLPYRPHTCFKAEMETLSERGMLVKKTSYSYDIIFEEEIVGEILEPEVTPFMKKNHNPKTFKLCIKESTDLRFSE